MNAKTITKAMKPRQLLTAALFALTALFSSQSFAQSPIYTAFFSDTAVSGYDTVAYFTQNKPVKGNSSYTTQYKGADWLFSNKANLEMFKADPEKYAPQYGGYCAWAVANNDTAKADPLQWAIHQGKLYLNYDADIRKKWFSDKDALIIKANNNWPNVIK